MSSDSKILHIYVEDDGDIDIRTEADREKLLKHREIDKKLTAVVDVFIDSFKKILGENNLYLQDDGEYNHVYEYGEKDTYTTYILDLLHKLNGVC